MHTILGSHSGFWLCHDLCLIESVQSHHLSLREPSVCLQDTFGLEYDLDLFNIVAVDDFNMGAMENKSLNIFNSRLVLASPETATDMDFARIEGVVGHEYFHNWTGDRVTCRDWFQLTLKEGLTVFRDQVPFPACCLAPLVPPCGSVL